MTIDVKFLEWSKRRADREMVNVVDWALKSGLTAPLDQVNAQLHAWGHDVGEACVESKPPPKDGVCSGVHADAAGWLALLSWKHDDPEISRVEYSGYAKPKISCLDLKSSSRGFWEAEAHPGRWFGRVCSGATYQMVVLQLINGGPHEYARTSIVIYTDGFLEFDERSRLALGVALKKAGL